MFHNMMLAGSLQGGNPRYYDHLPGVDATFAQKDLSGRDFFKTTWFC